MHFTTQQLVELETRYGLTPVQGEILPVRDGAVTKTTMVWWRGERGPECVPAGEASHWENIRRAPEYYQLEKPHYRVEYID